MSEQHITKGEIIAQLKPTAFLSDAEAKLAAYETNVEAATRNLETSERAVRSVQAIVEALKARLAILEFADRQEQQSFDASIEAAEATVGMKQQELVLAEAAFKDADNQFKVASTVVDQVVISQQDFTVKETQRTQAQAKVRHAVEALQVANAQLKKATLGKKGKLIESDKLNQVKVDLAKSQADLVAAEGELAHALATLDQTKRKRLDLQHRLESMDRFEIASPFTGKVVSIGSSIYSGSTVQEGEVICRIQPTEQRDVAASTGHTTESQTPRRKITRPPQDHDASNKPPARQVLRHSALSSFGTVSDLARRFREAETDLLELKLQKARHSLDIANKELIDIQEKAKSAKQGSEDTRYLEQQLFENRSKVAMFETKVVEVENSLRNAQQLLSEAKKEKATIVALLKNKVTACEERLKFTVDNERSYQHAFEVGGEVSRAELMENRQAVIAAKSELDELKILLDHYEQVGDSQ